MKTVTVSTVETVKDALGNIKDEILNVVDSGQVEETLNGLNLTLTKANSTVARQLTKTIVTNLFLDEDLLSLIDSKLTQALENQEFLSETLADMVDEYEDETEEVEDIEDEETDVEAEMAEDEEEMVEDDAELVEA